VSQDARSVACPYCGEPKDRHSYASPTSCVLGGFPPTRIENDEGGSSFQRRAASTTRLSSAPPTASAARTLDREKTELQETGRLKVFQLDFAELTEIVDSLGCDPRYVAVTGDLRVEDRGAP
jgi:hypothetical protein